MSSEKKRKVLRDTTDNILDVACVFVFCRPRPSFLQVWQIVRFDPDQDQAAQGNGHRAAQVQQRVRNALCLRIAHEVRRPRTTPFVVSMTDDGWLLFCPFVLYAG